MHVRQQTFRGAELEVVCHRKPVALFARETSQKLFQQFSATVANVNPLRDRADQCGGMLLQWVQRSQRGSMAIQQGDTLRYLPGNKVLTQRAQQLANRRCCPCAVRDNPFAAWLSQGFIDSSTAVGDCDHGCMITDK